jgi:hypothetical protein
MERVFLFSILQLGVSLYALARGGGPERVVGLSLLLAFGVTMLLQQPLVVRFVTVEWGVLAVDLALLAVLLAVALHADRFWPLWVAALHALGTGAHLVRGLDHGIEPVAYAILLASWSYPIVILLAVGTLRHAERRKRNGHDLDWSFPMAGRPRAG